MKLADYLNSHKQTASAFAALIGVSPSTITRLSKGDRNPSFDLIDRICHATGGAVTANDFVAQIHAGEIPHNDAEAQAK